MDLECMAGRIYGKYALGYFLKYIFDHILTGESDRNIVVVMDIETFYKDENSKKVPFSINIDPVVDRDIRDIKEAAKRMGKVDKEKVNNFIRDHIDEAVKKLKLIFEKETA
jgi:hypothetical protein